MWTVQDDLFAEEKAPVATQVFGHRVQDLVKETSGKTASAKSVKTWSARCQWIFTQLRQRDSTFGVTKTAFGVTWTA